MYEFDRHYDCLDVCVCMISFICHDVGTVGEQRLREKPVLWEYYQFLFFFYFLGIFGGWKAVIMVVIFYL